MPFMDTDSGDTTGEAVNDTPGDLPVLDAEVIENTVTEDAQAVTEGSEGEEPDTDGSY
jgi:hypothetical protein